LTSSRVLIGGVEVLPVLDALAPLGELAELYPDPAPKDWEPYRSLYPELFAGTSWRVPCTCYVLRTSDTTLLVDTGLGPPGLVDWELEFEGGLPEGLADLGIGREDVDVVFLTHLHIDHLGWNTDASGEVFFPRARYVVHREALAYARDRRKLPHIARCVEPLADRFETLGGETELAVGITAVSLPGHYPGHMGVRISSRRQEAFLIVDAAVHPALLDRPEWTYVSDSDHERCVETRRSLVDELANSDVLVASGHYPGAGLGRLLRRDGRVSWEATFLDQRDGATIGE
jgi:glyoxylase-like metal-dependent hydrolase (beta-lactamase superfamily II)